MSQILHQALVGVNSSDTLLQLNSYFIFIVPKSDMIIDSIYIVHSANDDFALIAKSQILI